MNSLQYCTVRSINDEDLEEVLSWRNHQSVRQFMFNQHEITLAEHFEWYERVRKDSSRRMLIVQDRDEPIGFVQFYPVTMGGVADWGFYARPNAPKGSGYKLGLAALNYAFKELGLHKVCGQALDSNMASIAFHRKLGFVQEGVLREQKMINEQYCSLVCFGLLAHEWQI